MRLIFQRYLTLGCVRTLRDDLIASGVVSKRRVYEDGRVSGGLPFSRGALYHLLQNPVYRGMIVHRDNAYPGEHAPIVDQDLWDAVQAKLQANGVERTDSGKADPPAILTGLLFDAAGEPMTPTHAVKNGVRYRYYVSRHLVTGVKREGAGQRLPAPAIESLVVDRLRTFLIDPSAFDAASPELGHDAPARKHATVAVTRLTWLLDEPANPKRADLLRAVLGRVQVHAERVEVELCRRSVNYLLSSDQAPEESLAALATSSGAAEMADASSSDPGPIRLEITTQMRRRGNELKFLVAGENVEESRAVDENLVRLIVRARILARRIRENPAATLTDVAAQEGFRLRLTPAVCCV